MIPSEEEGGGGGAFFPKSLHFWGECLTLQKRRFCPSSPYHHDGNWSLRYSCNSIYLFESTKKYTFGMQ